MPPTSSHRIAWLDTLKVIAGILMLIDHTAVYVGGLPDWVRLYLTRCVEPLYAFTLFYLLAKKGKPIGWKRWSQLAAAAAAECALMTAYSGHLTFGILASFAMVTPLAPRLSGLRAPLSTAVVAVSGWAATISFEGSPFDYDPLLVAGQAMVVGTFAATGGRSASLLLVQAIGMLVGIMTAAHLGLVISPNIMTLMVGQPVAIGMVWLVKMLGREVSPGIVLRLIAKGPLRFYLGHLVLLQGIAMALR